MRHAIVDTGEGRVGPADAGDEGEARRLPGVVAVFADAGDRDLALAAIALRRAAAHARAAWPGADYPYSDARRTPADWEIR